MKEPPPDNYCLGWRIAAGGVVATCRARARGDRVLAAKGSAQGLKQGQMVESVPARKGTKRVVDEACAMLPPGPWRVKVGSGALWAQPPMSRTF